MKNFRRGNGHISTVFFLLSYLLVFLGVLFTFCLYFGIRRQKEAHALALCDSLVLCMPETLTHSFLDDGTLQEEDETNLKESIFQNIEKNTRPAFTIEDMNIGIQTETDVIRVELSYHLTLSRPLLGLKPKLKVPLHIHYSYGRITEAIP